MVVRVLNAGVYGGLAVLATSALAGPLVPAVKALGRPFSHAPQLAAPWLWPLLAFAVAFGVADGIRRLASGRPLGLWRYGALLALVGVSLAAVRFVRPEPRPVALDGISHLIARVEATASEGWARDRRYPAEAQRYEAALPARLRDLGFRRRGGVLLHSRVHVLTGSGPALRPTDGVRPGDVVVVLDQDRRRYWITGFQLDRRGRMTPVGDRRGRALIAAAVEGRPGSRLDPLFPEYPNRLPVRAPGVADAAP